MKVIKVVGLKYEDRDKVLKDIINSFKDKGTLTSWRGYSDEEIIEEYIEPCEFESQLLINAIDLVQEPNNPHDPNVVKVMMFDAHGNRHHIGYVPKEETQYINLNFKVIKQVDAEITGGTQKLIEVDDDANDYIIEQEYPYGLTLHITDLTMNNPFVKVGDGSTKTKVMNRIGCGIFAFIILMIIIILFI